MGAEISMSSTPDWFHIPIPIWIQVEGIVVTVRLRMQMVPQIPYLRNLTFTLMGVPKVEISAIPMSRLVCTTACTEPSLLAGLTMQYLLPTD